MWHWSYVFFVMFFTTRQQLITFGF